MSILGNTLLFKGIQLFTPKEIKKLIKTYVDAKAFYKLNGLLGKMAYINAMKALIDAMVEFAPYVNGIAKGNKKILAASTLPTTEVVKDVAKMFKEGLTASSITVKQGKVTAVHKVFKLTAIYPNAFNFVAAFLCLVCLMIIRHLVSTV